MRPQGFGATPSFRNLLRGRVLLIAAASWCFMCGTFGIFSILGFHVQDHFHLGAVEAARFMGLGLMGAAGVNVLMQSFVIRRLKVSVKGLVAIGVPLTIASFVFMWMAGGVWGFVAALMLNGFGQSFVNPAFTTALSLSVGAAGQGRLTGVLHCFTSSLALARHALGLGLYISISGIVTFKNAEELRETVRQIPLDRLLVETDSPFLAPVPVRGKTCEPAFVVHTAARLAELKSVSAETLAATTTQNFFTLFARARPGVGAA